MAEYIKREALIAEIEENINTYWNEGGGGYYLAEDALNYSVKTAPTADVAEVVRCKDCKYYVAEYCTRDIKGRTNMFYMQSTDYCSYGERRNI